MEALTMGWVNGTQSIGQEDFDRLADQFLSCIAELSFELTVDEENRPVRTDDQDTTRQRLGREPKKVLRLEGMPPRTLSRWAGRF
jgi:hypothetical protein